MPGRPISIEGAGRARFAARLLVLLSAILPAPTAAAVAEAGPFVVVLGTAQDGGYPQAGCDGACCRRAWSDPAARRRVASLAVVDPGTGGRWLIDATPDFREQLHALDAVAPPGAGALVSGVLLTHAHVGHYSGLLHLGHEVIGARGVPVYAMPRMRRFLSGSGPWDQLVRYDNIELRPLQDGAPVDLAPGLTAIPFRVPHRDEYSETVGFRIRGPLRSVLYLPDIDKWSRWETPLPEALASVDVAYLDGSFFADGELPGRDMSQVRHPFIRETMELLRHLPAPERAKVRFLHLNHTNPALDPDGDARRQVREAGMRVAEEGEQFLLGRAD